MTKKSARLSSTVVGYLRVSTEDQNIEKNKADILQLANRHDLGRVRFVEEKISGKVSWRKRKVAEMLESLQANDAIVVSELSRLGRSMLECMEILSVAAQKRINVLFGQEGLALRPEHPKQNHRDGLLDGCGDRT